MVENGDLQPFNISPEEFVWLRNFNVLHFIHCLGPLEMVVNNLHVVYGSIEHFEYHDLVYKTGSICSNFGTMHGHKTGTDGNACSICDNRRQESDIRVSEIVLLSHFMLGSVKFYTMANLVSRMFSTPVVQLTKLNRPTCSADRATASDREVLGWIPNRVVRRTDSLLTIEFRVISKKPTPMKTIDTWLFCLWSTRFLSSRASCLFVLWSCKYDAIILN